MSHNTTTSFSVLNTLAVGDPMRAHDYDILRTNIIYLNSNSEKRMTTGTFTRTLSLTGDQNITGVGFSASNILIFSAVQTGFGFSWGGSNNGTNSCVAFDDNGNGTSSSSNAIYLNTLVANSAAANATISIGSDGFGVKWAITGSPSATGLFTYLAIGR